MMSTRKGGRGPSNMPLVYCFFTIDVLFIFADGGGQKIDNFLWMS